MKIRKMKKLLKNYLENNNIYGITIKFADDFSFDETNNTITIGTEKGSYKDFMNLCKSLGYKGNASARDLCFLHELGHYFTYKNFNQEQEQYDNMVRQHLYKAIESDNTKIVKKALKCYYHLPQEIEATKYGIKLANTTRI